MTNLSRVRSTFTGFAGAPGVATMFFLDAIPPVAALKTFWTAVAASMPPAVSILVESAGDIIDDSTGDLVGSWSAATTTASVGQMGGSYSAPTGAVIRWTTGTVLDSHRVKGRTFVVPMAGARYDTDGSLAAQELVELNAAAAALVTAATPTFVVWHRPLSAAAAAKRTPPPTPHPGGFAIITGSSVADKVAVLRSRRD